MAGTQSTSSDALMQGETPSPLCNHLLEQARLRFEGEVSSDELRAGIATALESLAAAREQTLAALESNGAKEEVLDAFERSFEDMQTALEDLDDFAGNGEDEEAYMSVRDSIMAAALSATYAATTMQTSQLMDGPTDMPLFNALFKMKEGYLEGGIEGDQLRDALTNVVAMTKEAIKELLAAEGEQPPQRDGLVKAYENQLESLSQIDETVSAGGDSDQVEAAFQQLLTTSNGVKEAMSSLNDALMGSGPCRMARTNILLSALNAMRTEGLSPDAFSDSLEIFENEIREERARFLELAGLPGQTEAVQQEIEGVREAFDLHDDAIALFHDILNGDAEEAEFENAKSALIDASEMLSDRKEALETLGESEGKISCVRCGALNDPTFRVCGKCGAQLPQQAGAGVASTVSYQEDDGQASTGEGELEMTDNLERLFTKVNEIAEERCSDEEFEEVLIWMDGLIRGAQSTMPEVPNLLGGQNVTEDLASKIEMLHEALEDERNSMMLGMGEVQAALGTLQSFLENRDKEVLIAGVRQVRDGALKMQNANRELAEITKVLHEAHEYAKSPEGQAALKQAAEEAEAALEEARRRAEAAEAEE